MAGLPELITYSKEEYIDEALKLFLDEEYYTSVLNKLSAVDLQKTVFHQSQLDAQSFVLALDYMMDNYKKLERDKETPAVIIPHYDGR